MLRGALGFIEEHESPKMTPEALESTVVLGHTGVTR